MFKNFNGRGFVLYVKIYVKVIIIERVFYYFKKSLKVEISLVEREYGLNYGEKMDYLINGV